MRTAPTASRAFRRCGTRLWRRWRCRRRAAASRSALPSARCSRPHLAGGGWAFQYKNDFYPDLDDTAVIAWAMRRARDYPAYAYAIARALDWLVGMQSSNGGFAAFD